MLKLNGWLLAALLTPLLLCGTDPLEHRRSAREE